MDLRKLYFRQVIVQTILLVVAIIAFILDKHGYL